MTCSICGRDPRGHVAGGSGPDVVCKGCVQTIATELEGFALVYCVCGGQFHEAHPRRGEFDFPEYECRECQAPAARGDFDFALTLAERK